MKSCEAFDLHVFRLPAIANWEKECEQWRVEYERSRAQSFFNASLVIGTRRCAFEALGIKEGLSSAPISVVHGLLGSVEEKTLIT